MKNRKTVIVAFLLVAAMLLGVGYAALSDNLYVDGTLNVSAEDVENAYDQEVYFANATKATTGTGTGADSIGIGNDTEGGTNDMVTFAVNSLKTVGEVATFTFDIVNENDYAVNIELTNSNTNSCFKVTVSEVTQVSANGSEKVTVTVELIAVPASGANVTESFDLTYKATSVE